MSDILLSFGIQKGAADVERIRGDINSILASLDKNPPKVRVGLTIDESAIAHFKSQLSSVLSSISLTNGTPITINVSGLGEITAEAGRAKSALGGVADAARNASKATQEATDKTKQSTSQTAKAAQDAARAEQQRQSLLKQSTNLITKMKDAERNWTAAATGHSKGSYENIRSYRIEMESLHQQFLNGQISADQFKARLNELNTGFTTSAAKIRAAGEQSKTFSDRLSGLAAKFSTWLSVSQVIMLAYRTIKKMVSSVIELDTAMTELKKVTDETDATYARFLDGATDRAKKLGASISDTVNATADFARLGYGIDDASKLADTAIIYKNIGDGIENIADASESIISTLQAFGIEASDAISIVDKFNEVGNNFAISSAGIGEAMKRSAAAMNSANNTIDETIALITAANTIVQNPESVGTTLKTVSMYLRAAKTEAEEAGESTDGMANSVSELRDEILSLTGQKVDIQIDDDTFKSTYQILEELSKVWHNLTDVSQANLLELIGGKRNANVVSALLENFKVAEDALKSSMEAAGSAVAENEKYLDSIKGKIAEFTAQFESFSSTFINGEFVKGVVEFGTFLFQVLEVAGNLVNALGGLSNVLFTIAGIILTIKIDSIIRRLTLIASSIKNLTFLTGTFGTTFKECFRMAQLDGANRFRATLTGLSAGFEEVIASASAAQLVVGGFVALISVLSAVSRLQDKIIANNQETINSKLSAVSETQSVYDLYVAYDDAKSKLDDNAESKQILQTASENLAAALGIEKDAVDNLSESYKQLTVEELSTAVSDAKIAIDAAEKNVSKLIGGIKNLTNPRAVLTTQTYGMMLGIDLDKTYNTTAEKAKDIMSIYELMDARQRQLVESSKTNTLEYGNLDAAIRYLKPQVESLTDANSSLADATERYNNVLNGIPKEQEAVSNSTEELVENEKDLAQTLKDIDFAGVSENLTTLRDAFKKLSDGTLGLEDVIQLIQKFPELAGYVDFTSASFGNLEEGLEELIRTTPDGFINALQQFKETNGLTGEAADQIDDLCDSMRNLSASAIRDASGEFGVLADAINAAKDAQTELEKALAEDDWDAGYEGRVNAFKDFREVLKAGEYGSKAFAAYKEYFGLMEKSPKQIEEWIKANKKYFTEGTDGILEFLMTVDKLDGKGNPLEGIASYDSKTGAFWYDINKLTEFADALGWTEEMLQDFIYKYRMYADEWTSRSPQDTLTELTNANLVFSVDNSTFASLDELIRYTGLSADEVKKLVGEMNKLREQSGLEPIQLIGSDKIAVTQSLIDNLMAAGVEADRVKSLILELSQQEGVEIELNASMNGQTVAEMIAEATGDGSEAVSVDINMSVNDEEIIATVTTTAEQIEAILGKDWKAKITGDTLDAEEDIEVVSGLLNNLPSDTLVSVTDATLTARSNLSTVLSYLNKIEANKNKQITVTWKTSGVPHFATGTKKASSGPALLGDEYSPSGSPKPELVVSGDTAYIAGKNGPEIGYLHDGDVVYTADETKKILQGNNVHDSINAFAGGLASGLAGKKPTPTKKKKKKSGSSSSSSSSSSSKSETWFEKQLRDHRHLVEMDQESTEEYLNWLATAYQQAYEEGIISLEEYYQYQEEVYNGAKDLFKDHLNDIDHEISMLEGTVGSSDEVIAMAMQAMSDIEEELAAARALGLDENDEYIQYLEQQWLGYSETVTDLREKAETDAQDSVDNLVEYRIKMLKQEIEDEKDALSEKLSNLQKFYDDQRKMLQDQYDEEKYLEEQSEKRKAVTDIDAELAKLEFDNSAWAQKRKQELLAEKAKAEKELSDFEREHALDNAMDMLDEQQAIQEQQIQAEIDALDEKLNDPHALFNQALNDIKNNTADLYQQFIEYNRRYGTGNDKDIADMWEAAHIADLEYRDTHDGKSKDDIQIGNYTGYVAPTPQAPPEPPAAPPEPPTPPTPPTPTTITLPKNGASVTVKKSATHYGTKSGSKRMHSSVPGGKYTAYKTYGSGKTAQILIGRNGTYTGWVKLTDLVGYKHGTDHSIGGLARFDEQGKGSEYIFESSDGNRYRMFAEGSKVLNADATNFLYKFATTGGGILAKMVDGLLNMTGLGNISRPVQAVEIHTGDIVVQGNANEKTVSEIRRAQRDSINYVIKEFNKLNK